MNAPVSSVNGRTRRRRQRATKSGFLARASSSPRHSVSLPRTRLDGIGFTGHIFLFLLISINLIETILCRAALETDPRRTFASTKRAVFFSPMSEVVAPICDRMIAVRRRDHG